jgi:hypothetical protein
MTPTLYYVVYAAALTLLSLLMGSFSAIACGLRKG